MHLRTRLALSSVAALALCALCSCSNDDTSSPSGGSGTGTGTGSDTDGTYTLSGAVVASGGQCSALTTPVSGSPDVVQIVITCYDAPEPIINLGLNVPYPPAVGVYDLAQTSVAADDLGLLKMDGPLGTSADSGLQSLMLNLTSVDTSAGSMAVTVDNDHGTLTASFLMSDGTSVVNVTASF